MLDKYAFAFLKRPIDYKIPILLNKIQFLQIHFREKFYLDYC